MKYKKILIATILLLAILTVGAVSASDDADTLAVSSDDSVQEDTVLGNSTDFGDEPVINGTGIEIGDLEGKFTIDELAIFDTNNGGDTFATMNLPTATEGSIVITRENDIIYQREINAGDLNRNTNGFYYNILVGDLDLSDVVGKEFLKLNFYNSNFDSLIGEVYQIDKNGNQFTMGPAEYLEIYNSIITEETEGPIAVVFAPMQYLQYRSLWISDDDYTFGFYPDNLMQLSAYDHGIYSKNHVDGWAYYGITAARFRNIDGFIDLAHGKNLTFIAYKMNNGLPQDRIVSELRYIYRTEYGFYFTEDAYDEPDEPTLIIEVYGTEDSLISYDNGVVFAMIISGDEKTGEWKPVDELTDVTVRVTSEDGETEFLNVVLGDLNYTASGYMNIIEHFFTLNDVDNFGNLEDGDIVRFYMEVPTYGEDYLEYIIHFEDDGIMMELISDDDVGILIQDMANVATDDVVVVIDPNKLPDDHVEIRVNVWGHVKSTNWDFIDLEPNDDGMYEFTVSDLKIDKIMWDINLMVRCDVSVTYYDDELVQEMVYERTSNVYTNPYISKGDIIFQDPDHDSSVPMDDAITFIDFDLFEEMGCYDEFTITSTSDKASITKNFNMSQMDQYWYDDEEEGYYALSLEDLGITETGSYAVDIEFNYPDGEGTQSMNFIGSLDVVEFDIYVPYGEDKSEDLVDDISLSIFRIGLPANTTNKVRVYVDGTKVLDKSLADIGTVTNPMGRQVFAIFLNDLQITDDSDKHNVRLEVLDENNNLLRNVSTDIWVHVGENSIGFADILYLTDGYLFPYLGTPVPQISDIVLFLNGQRAGVGKFADVFGFTFELEDAFKDQFGYILPGHYDAQAILVSPDGNQTLGSGGFSVLDDSGDVEIDVFEDDSNLYLQIRGSQPDADIIEYRLTIMVDPIFDQTDEDPEMIIYEDYDLEELLDGQVHTIYLGGYEPGSHIVWVEYDNYWGNVPLDEQDYFIRLFNVTIPDYEPIDTIITADDVTAEYNDGTRLVATLTDDDGFALEDFKLKIVVPGKLTKYIRTDANGQVSLDISNLDPGVYDATITFVGDDFYNKATATAHITVVNKIGTIIDAADVTANYKDGTKLVATLRDENGNAISGAKLKIVVPGKLTKYITTDASGQVSLDISNLDVGVYDATITFVGNDLYKKSTATAKITVTDKVDTVLTADDVTANYKDGSSLVATLKDAAGNAISGAKIKIVINKVSKYISTDANGQVALSLNNLEPGIYDATITFVATELYNKASTTAKVTITNKLDTVLTASDVTANYKDDSKLVATLKDVNGNAISGAKIKIVINKVSKYISTDANGQVALSLSNLEVGTYDATITFVATELYNKASTTAKVTIVNKIATVITAPDVTAGYKDGSKLVATIKDAAGNAISGVKIKIVINKVSKYITTDANGQVSLSLNNLEVGTYDATITFVGDDIYAKATTTANIAITDKINTVLTAPDVTASYQDGSKLVATLKDTNGNAISGAKIKIVLNKVTKYISTDANGQVALSLNNLNVGSYTAAITFVATDLYNKSTASAKVTIV